MRHCVTRQHAALESDGLSQYHGKIVELFSYYNLSEEKVF